MSKNILDKYYTNSSVASLCYNRTMYILNGYNITEIIEPSAGNGVFLDLNPEIIGYDIDPDDTRIQKQDFLELQIQYKKGRLVLGNPPYGRCLYTAQKFYKKAVSISDYISFILPISQLNNNRTFYEFDLIDSFDLGINTYSDRNLHCVLNTYVRPQNGLNKKPQESLKDISIYRQDSKNYNYVDFDVRMCYWGNSSAGKILTENDSYSAEYKIKIWDDNHREEIKNFIIKYNWNAYVQNISMKKIQQHHIINVLKQKFPYLK